MRKLIYPAVLIALGFNLFGVLAASRSGDAIGLLVGGGALALCVTSTILRIRQRH